MSDIPQDVAGIMTGRIMTAIREAVEEERGPNSGYMILENTPHIRGRVNKIFQAVYQQLHKDLVEAAELDQALANLGDKVKEAVVVPTTFTTLDTGKKEPIPVRPRVTKDAFHAVKGERKKPRGSTRATNRTPPKRRKK